MSGCTWPGAGRAPDRVRLAFGRALVGTALTMRNSATTRLRAYAHRQPLRDRRETVDFTTRAELIDRDSTHDLHRVRVTTTAKDGHSSLREMAFPELHETIEYELGASGEVRRAGRYPAASVFFIPSLPVPLNDVRVGDTWTFDHDYISGVDHFPLRLELVGILKEIRRCLKGHVCADVEVSGHVALRVPPDNAAARFESRLRGRALFDVDRGEVVWADVRSREEITLGPEVSMIESCLVSRVDGAGALACAPEFEAPIEVPTL